MNPMLVVSTGVSVAVYEKLGMNVTISQARPWTSYNHAFGPERAGLKNLNKRAA